MKFLKNKAAQLSVAVTSIFVSSATFAAGPTSVMDLATSLDFTDAIALTLVLATAYLGFKNFTKGVELVMSWWNRAR